MATETKVGCNIGPFFAMLTVLFIGLKLTGNIAWSWWWVLAPMWMPIAVALLICLLAFTLAMFLE